MARALPLILALAIGVAIGGAAGADGAISLSGVTVRVLEASGSVADKHSVTGPDARLRLSLDHTRTLEVGCRRRRRRDGRGERGAALLMMCSCMLPLITTCTCCLQVKLTAALAGGDADFRPQQVRLPSGAAPHALPCHRMLACGQLAMTILARLLCSSHSLHMCNTSAAPTACTQAFLRLTARGSGDAAYFAATKAKGGGLVVTAKHDELQKQVGGLGWIVDGLGWCEFGGHELLGQAG